MFEQGQWNIEIQFYFWVLEVQHQASSLDLHREILIVFTRSGIVQESVLASHSYLVLPFAIHRWAKAQEHPLGVSGRGLFTSQLHVPHSVQPQERRASFPHCNHFPDVVDSLLGRLRLSIMYSVTENDRLLSRQETCTIGGTSFWEIAVYKKGYWLPQMQLAPELFLQT